MQATLKHNGKTIQLGKKPFAGGGEGSLYHIVSPVEFQHYVVKVYHDSKRTAKQEQKINYLVANPPALLSQNHNNSIIWPTDVVSVNKEFAGFMMPFAKGTKLEVLCTQKLPKKNRKRWERFDLKQEDSIALRMKVCYNIAAAVFQIHATKKYVLVDLKPDNVIIQPNGLIALVDIDSVEVIKAGEVIFPSKVATPEYSPPEYYRDTKPGESPIYETWDRFSLAVIFYKLLFGIHPYAGTSLPPYDNLVALQDKIEHGLFVHSPNKRDSFKIIPPPHKKFEIVPAHLQNLFLRCFVEGHQNEAIRPTANEWCWSLTPKHPLAINRKLPSIQVPLTHIEPTVPMSLVPVIAQKPTALKPFRNSGVRYIAIQKSPNFTRGVALFSLLLIVGWLFTMPVAFNWMTFFQILSIVFTNFAIAAIEYYSLPEVAAKAKALHDKYEISKQRIQQRKELKQLDASSASVFQGYKALEKDFQKEQQQLLTAERQQVLALSSTYNDFLKEKNKLALQLSEEELNRLQTAEKKLLGKYADDEIFKEISFLPITQRLDWFETELNRQQIAIESKAEKTLKTLNDKLNNIEAVVRQEYKLSLEEKEILVEETIKQWRTEHKILAEQLVKEYMAKQKTLLTEPILPNLKMIMGRLGIANLPTHFRVNNILTAGDFHVLNNGKVLTTDGLEINIRGLDRGRATALEKWQDNLKKSIPNFPTYPNTIEDDERALEDKIRLLRRDLALGSLQSSTKISKLINEKRIALHAAIEQVKQDAKVEKERLITSNAPLKAVLAQSIDKFEQIQTDVLAEYNAKYEELYKACEVKKVTTTKQITSVKTTTKEQVNQLFSKALSKQSNDIKATRAIVQSLETETKLFNELNQTFVEKSKEVLQYQKVTFRNYLKEVYTFRKP